MSQHLKNQLTNIVQESAIADIIMSDKKDMDFIVAKQNYKKWVAHKRQLRCELEEASEHIENYKKYIKENCKHTDVTEEISPGFERASHDYHCNQCEFSVRIHDEFSYKNITKVVNN